LELLEKVWSDEFFHMCKDHLAGGALETFNLRAKLIDHPDVIGVQEGQEGAIGDVDPTIARCGYTGPVLSDIADARVTEVPNHVESSVGGTVVHDNNLEIADGLGSDTP
jgi:hypothetical protein